MEGIPLLSAIDTELIPLDLINSDSDLVELLSAVIITDYNETTNIDDSVTTEYSFSFQEEVNFGIMGVDGLNLVFGGGTDPLVVLGWTGGNVDGYSIFIHGELKLRFDNNLLIPVVKSGDIFISDPNNKNIDISLSAGFELDQDFAVRFNGGNNFVLDPVMIGNSGVVVEGEIAFDLSENEALPESIALGLTEAWKGAIFKTLTIHLPNDINVPILPSDLKLENFHIGNGGISGDIEGNWNNSFDEISGSFIGNGTGDLFGMAFALKEIKISFYQNTIAENTIKGSLLIPFFQLPVDIELGLTNDGDFTIALADPDGLLTLEKENIISIDVTSLEFFNEDNTFSIKLTGKITPLLANLNWPSFELKGITIGSDGTVKVEGGWIELPDQKALDFHGFQIDIEQLGFGSDEMDGELYKWVGFSGGIQIVQALPLRGGVEGLKVMWTEADKFKLKIGGVYLSFEVPNVLTFDGSVYFIDEENPDIKEFRGSVSLNLIPLNLGIDAQFITGRTTDYNYFYIAVGLDLPIGIPLGPPVLGLYGLAGLYGNNMTLDYQSLIDYDDVSERPDLTDASPHGQWINQKDAMAFGAGLTVGTLPDARFIVKTKVLFVILVPGPVLLVEGHAGMLSLADNYQMKVLAVLDPSTGTFLFNISADYQFPKNTGELLDISGSAEALFNTADVNNWHLYLGENKPESKWIRADILKFFKAQTYLMVDQNGLLMGVWIGYGLDEKYGILRVVLDAWISGELGLSPTPIQAKGSATLYGNAELSASMVKLGISVETNVSAQAPKPITIEGSLEVQLKTPVGKPKATIKLKWEKTGEPPFPVPLSNTLGIEHRKVIKNWDIQKTSTYLVDDDGLYLGSELPVATISDIPVVPPDVCLILNFDKPVIDNSQIAANPAPINANEKVGDYEFKYELAGLTLQFREEWDEAEDIDESAWSEFVNQNGDTDYNLTGVWQIMPDSKEVNNTKLVLNASSPFEISRVLEEKEMWFGLINGNNPNYPCNGDEQPDEICVDFESRERAYYYGVLEQDDFLFTSPYPMVVHGYQALWLETENALNNPDNYETIECIDIKGQEPTENIKLKNIDKFIFVAGIGYDSYLKLTNEFSNDEIEMYINQSQMDLPNGIIPAYIYFPELFFADILLEINITCITGDYTIFYAFDEDENVVDTQVLDKSNTAEQLKFTSDVPIRKIGMLGYGIRILEICYTVNHRVETMNILVTAPQDFVNVDVHLSKYSHGTIYFYDKENNEVQQTEFDVPGTLRDEEVLPVSFSTQSTEPFRSFLVSGWFDIIRVCGVTQEAKEIYEYNAGLNTRLQESLEENWGRHTAQILLPNRYYRLKIETITSRRKNQGNWVEEQYTEHMYFKTGNPPGPASAIQENADTEDRYDLEGPLMDLSPYVDYTIPYGASAGQTQPAIYRSYDIGVVYNDSYIDQMYQMSGFPLKIRILDNNNLPVLNAEGDPLEFINLWGDNPELALTEEETVYKDILNESGCIAMTEVTEESKTEIIAFSRDLLLKPQIQYRAQVIAGEEKSIYEFAFTSSRYASFKHHVHSFENAVWNHFALLDDPEYVIDDVILEQILNNPDEDESVKFELLMELFQLNPRMNPGRSEIALINDLNQSYGLLLESPEPFDWLRTDLGLSYIDTQETISEFTGIVKVLGFDIAEQWVDIMLMETADISDFVLEYRPTDEPDPNAFTEYFRFREPGNYNAGIQIRIHNGFDPGASAEETEHNNLYANHTNDSFSTDEIVLRIKNAAGEIVQEQIFYDNNEFLEKNVNIIRNEDGSKCFIFLNENGQQFSSFQEGIYQIDFTFIRDLSPEYQVLKRFGFSNNEEAKISFSLPAVLPG